jgi:hypothetical protein
VSEVITDASGRKLTIRKLNVLEQVRLLKAVGSDHSQNQPYVQIVMMAASVSDIDGVPVPLPRTDAQIEGLIGRIDDAGFAALQVALDRKVADLYAAAEASQPDPLAPSA